MSIADCGKYELCCGPGHCVSLAHLMASEKPEPYVSIGYLGVVLCSMTELPTQGRELRAGSARMGDLWLRTKSPSLLNSPCMDLPILVTQTSNLVLSFHSASECVKFCRDVSSWISISFDVRSHRLSLMPLMACVSRRQI